ncbi:hypothetical protein NC652_000020 [Populus alba x Populus x berolinensis]|nr:hypothetical protein NC652_000020 [Populus alba x Populus x berolinensis]
MGIPHQRCRDFEERGFCLRGDMCPLEHCVNRIVVEDVQIVYTNSREETQNKKKLRTSWQNYILGSRLGFDIAFTDYYLMQLCFYCHDYWEPFTVLISLFHFPRAQLPGTTSGMGAVPTVGAPPATLMNSKGMHGKSNKPGIVDDGLGLNGAYTGSASVSGGDLYDPDQPLWNDNGPETF